MQRNGIKADARICDPLLERYFLGSSFILISSFMWLEFMCNCECVLEMGFSFLFFFRLHILGAKTAQFTGPAAIKKSTTAVFT